MARKPNLAPLIERLINRDTIVAIATPPGRGGVGIIRVSGPHVGHVAITVLGKLPTPRMALLSHFWDLQGETIDIGLSLFFPGPNSYTGEDVLEFQTHGSPIILDQLLKSVLDCGCRLARPGEFTERAFLNSRLDLTQAEAVADLIDAGSVAAAKSALRSLTGAFAERIEQLLEQLIGIRTHLEASMDFADEALELSSQAQLIRQFATLREHIDLTVQRAQQGVQLKEGARLVIAGQPNAGKSSLLNCLTDSQTAIVTDVAGTTRDILSQPLSLDGLPLHLIDTAGLRESTDPVESEGIRRAWQAIAQADAVLLVIDLTKGEQSEDQKIRSRLPTDVPVITVMNKCDQISPQKNTSTDPYLVYVSALTGEGIDTLRTRLKDLLHYSGEDAVFIARRRHLDALKRAAHHVEKAQQLTQDNAGLELAAEECRQAQLAFDEITGRFTTEDLLGRIFSDFCIGK
ncbi:tRNA uridine-5-carboxymethylaminomethyl(34) synthesis GTPase MnmE [Ectothiorhodosinus mongolicus]|uniref:tRNA uridine-5-carboxymethylaminomethyl(34) synthesis GTPase MnmE n=1 Tax=Ectothiorhodosinus mongolicus TaxID=233100 RepID=UPI0030B7F63F